MDKQLIRLLLLFIICIAPAHSQILGGILNPIAGPTATKVVDCGNQGGPITTLACTLAGVATGDAIVSCAFNGSTSAMSVKDDLANAFTAGTAASGNTVIGQCFWLLSATAGSRTITMTTTAGTLGAAFWAIDFRAPAGTTWHIDTGNQNTGNNASLNTGNITTHTSTGEAILFGALLSNFAVTASNPLIGPITPTELSSSPQNTFQHAYYLINDKITAGSATLTYSGTTDWAGAVVSIYAQ